MLFGSVLFGSVLFGSVLFGSVLFGSVLFGSPIHPGQAVRVGTNPGGVGQRVYAYS
ncbi:MAG: hypothetical protein M3Z25_19590 [Actinomycetota bacterium]|nr:hypothetical protein [Actinomycetota bacterium]